MGGSLEQVKADCRRWFKKRVEGNDDSPKPLSESLTEIAVLFAERWNTTPFDVLNQDIDDFILIANTMIKKTHNTAKSTAKPKQQQKDSFWDF